MSKHGRYERVKPANKKKKPLLIVLVVLLVLIAAVVVAGVVYYKTMLDKIPKVDVEKIDYASLAETTEATEATTEEATETTETTTETTVETTEAHVASSADYINFLVVGQSSRDVAVEGYRFADTAILVTLNTYEKTITLTSLLRDTIIRGGYYKGHTYGGIKLATVYHQGYMWGDVAGAMELYNLTLYNNFGIEVDYNFEIDFEGFMKALDVLGGVDIEITEAEANYLNADDFWVYKDVEPGLAHLDAMTALCYARMRHAEGDNDSDIVRTERQRKLINAILQKVKSKSLSELQALADEMLPNFTTSMTNSEITDMLLTVLPMVTDLKIVNGGNCPANSQGDLVDIYGDGVMHSVLRFNEQETKAYMRAITEGEGLTEATE